MGEFLKKWGRFLLACGLYLITVVFMYIIRYKLFGNVIKPPLVYIIVFPVFAFLGWVVNGGYPKVGDEDENHEAELLKSGIYTDKKAKKTVQRPVRTRPVKEFIQKWQNQGLSTGQKISFAVSSLIVVAATLFMIYALFADPYTLNIYLYFGVLSGIGLMCFRSREKGRPLSAVACLLFIVMIVICVVYLLAVSPMTVRQGEKLLKDQGYENIYYETSVARTETLDKIFDHEPALLSTNAGGLGYYLFRCEKDGRMFGAALSVTDKNMVAVEPVDNESGLSFYLNFK